ncbi:MFS general substrate transporter, partial [Aureobasidium melanogenum]
TAHGFSAAVGKLGALLAAVLYNYITTQQKFYVVPWFGLAGALVTWLFLPDTTGLDLKEQERRWAFIRVGKGDEYHGVAIHPKHLSVWERFRGVGKGYDAELDYQQRVEEMRHEWEQAMASKAAEKENNMDPDVLDDEDWHSDISSFFARTKNGPRGAQSPLITPMVRGNEGTLPSPMMRGMDKRSPMPSPMIRGQVREEDESDEALNEKK